MRGLAAVAILATVIGGACGDDGDVTAELDTATVLVLELGLTDADDPGEVESTSVRYATATGLAAGDQDAVVARVGQALESGGWAVTLVEDLDVSARPATEGSRVLAGRDELAAQVAVFARVGANPAPPGTRWVEVDVACVPYGLNAKSTPEVVDPAVTVTPVWVCDV